MRAFKTTALSSLLLLMAVGARAENATIGRQSYSFQYLTGVLTNAQKTTPIVASGWNAAGAPKYFSMGVTTTSAAAFQVALQGSLDAANWSTLAVTNSVIGVVSSSIPKPMVYFRMFANLIGANVSLTATAIGTP